MKVLMPQGSRHGIKLLFTYVSSKQSNRLNYSTVSFTFKQFIMSSEQAAQRTLEQRVAELELGRDAHDGEIGKLKKVYQPPTYPKLNTLFNGICATMAMAMFVGGLIYFLCGHRLHFC